MKFIEYFVERLYEDAYLNLLTEEDIRDTRGGAVILDGNELNFLQRARHLAAHMKIPVPSRQQLFSKLLEAMPDPSVTNRITLTLKSRGQGKPQKLDTMWFDMDNMRAKFTAAGYDTSKPIKVAFRTIERWFQRGDASGVYRIYPDSGVTLVNPNQNAYNTFKDEIEKDIAKMVGNSYGVFIQVDPKGGLRHRVVTTQRTQSGVTEEEVDDAMQQARLYLLRRANVKINGQLAIKDPEWRRLTINTAIKGPTLRYFQDRKHRVGALRHQIDQEERNKQILPKDFSNQNADLDYARKIIFAKRGLKDSNLTNIVPWKHRGE